MKARLMHPDDAEIWRTMRHELWPGADEAQLRDEIRTYFTGTSPLQAVFLCEDTSARPIGFLELSLRSYSEGCRSSPVPHVEGWYVVAEARRRGVGQALMAAAEEWARGRGFSELASDVELTNKAGECAHLKAGFEEVERAIHFRKSLRAQGTGLRTP